MFYNEITNICNSAALRSLGCACFITMPRGQINYDLAEERNERVGGIYAPHASRIVLPRGYGR